MKVCIIYSHPKNGNTRRVTEKLVSLLPDTFVSAHIAPDNLSCLGCNNCFMIGESQCPHYDLIDPIVKGMSDADIVIIAAPTYALGIPGQLKSLFDHLAHRFLTHRPIQSLFDKIGISISTSAGYGEDRATGQIDSFLESLGITTRFQLPLKAYSYYPSEGVENRPDIVLSITDLIKNLEEINYKGSIAPNLNDTLAYFRGFAKDTHMDLDYEYLNNLLVDDKK